MNPVQVRKIVATRQEKTLTVDPRLIYRQIEGKSTRYMVIVEEPKHKETDK